MNNFEDKSVEDLESIFISACKENNFNMIKDLLINSELKDHIDPRVILDSISQMMTNKNIKNPALSQYLINFLQKKLNPQNTEEPTNFVNEKEHRRSLSKAIESDDLERTKYLLTAPEFQDFLKDYDFKSGLYNAVQFGNLEIVKLFITLPNSKDNVNIYYASCSPFIAACESGYTEIVDYFKNSPEIKEKHEDYDCEIRGLRMACKNGHLDVVKLLINHPDFLNKYGLSNSLSFATENNHSEIVKYLLTSSKCKSYIHDTDCQSAFNDACYKGNIELAKYLLISDELDKNAEINANIRNNDEYSYGNGVVAAIKGNQIDTLRFLIFDMNADESISIKNFLEKYPNEEATKMFKIKKINQEITESLINKNLQIKKKNNKL
jgi:ankyrin repeat protein